jgi:hypothetical protein
MLLQKLCQCAMSQRSRVTSGIRNTDTTGIPALVVSTDPRLLAHAETHAARYGTHRFLAQPLDLEALVTNIQERLGDA